MNKMKKMWKRIISTVLCVCMALSLMPAMTAKAENSSFTATFNIPAATVTSNLEKIMGQGFGTLKSVQAYVAYQSTKDTKMTFKVGESGVTVTTGGYTAASGLSVSNGSITGTISLTSDTYYLILLLTDTNGITASTGYVGDAATTDGITYDRSGNQKSASDTQTEIATPGLRLMTPTVTVSTDGSGTVSASGCLAETTTGTYTVKYGSTLTLTATPTSKSSAPYYGFYKWEKNDETSAASYDSSYTTAAITANTTYTAVFKEAPYQVDDTNYVLLADAADAAKSTSDKTITMTSTPTMMSSAYGNHYFTEGMKLVATDGTTYTAGSDVGIVVNSDGVICVNGIETGYDNLIKKGKVNVSADGSVGVCLQDFTSQIIVTSGEAFTIDSTSIPASATNLTTGQSVTIDGITYTAGTGTTSFPVTGAVLTNVDDAETVPAGTAATVKISDGKSVTVPSTNTGDTIVKKTSTGCEVTLAKKGDFVTVNGTTYAADADGTVITFDADGTGTVTKVEAADTWKETYKEILSKTTATVTTTDLDQIAKALAAYETLSDNAKSLLTAEKALLDSLEQTLKDSVNAQIDTDAKEVTDAMDALSNLSDDEKTELKKEVTTAVNTAKTAVESAATKDAITTAQEAFAKSLAEIQAKAVAQDLANAKTAANTSMESSVKEAEDAIDALTNLTDEEKAALKEKVDEAASTAKSAVDKAETTDAVSEALKTLADSLSDIKSDAEAQNALNKAQADALAQIEKDAQAAKDAIDAMTDLTDAEKTALKEKVAEAAATAKAAVDAATDKSGISTALSDLTNALTSVQTEAEAQNEENQVKDESGQSGNDLAKRSDLSFFIAKGTQSGTNSIKVTWNKVSGATGYEVYGAYCSSTQKYKKLKTVKASAKRAYTQKKLKKNKAYKYFVVAYKMVNGKKVYIGKTPSIHVAMKNNATKTNAKKITLNKTKVTLKASKTFQIKATIKKEYSWKNILTHAKKLRYYTTDASVATVSKSGKIKAKAKGSCKIYVVANNGVYKTITVKVK